jgi:6-phosphogluconolactonase
MIELIHQSISPEASSTLFADHILRWVNENNQNYFHISLSGGRTPVLLFKLLVEKYRELFPWQKIHLWWGDERMVPPGNRESNYRVAEKYLISNIPIPAGNVHRIRGEADPSQEVKRYADELESQLPRINQLPSFDLIILGLGEDGHTASIFPGQKNLIDSDNLTEISVHPVTSQVRITLTGKILNNSPKAAFLVTGKTKSKVLSKILHHHQDAEMYPAAHIRPIEELHWFIDKAGMPVKPSDY